MVPTDLYKYWWNQGLAFIQGQIYNPAIRLFSLSFPIFQDPPKTCFFCQNPGSLPLFGVETNTYPLPVSFDDLHTMIEGSWGIQPTKSQSEKKICDDFVLSKTVSTIYPDCFRFVNHEVLLFASEQWNTKACDEWNSAWCTHHHTSKYGEVPTSDTYTDESTMLDRMMPKLSSSQSYQIIEVHHVCIYTYYIILYIFIYIILCIYLFIHINMSIPFRSWQLHVFLISPNPTCSFFIRSEEAGRCI